MGNGNTNQLIALLGTTAPFSSRAAHSALKDSVNLVFYCRRFIIHEMNGADICHQVDGVAGLYVDAFKGKYLRRTQDPNNAFILSHYHGDHYQNLPREGKYQGPALIHCTSVTAALLVKVHQVPERWIIPHEYGESWTFKTNKQPTEEAIITFYDANHCPGACIILIHLADGTAHLHTGDMRYHERFKSYPLLNEAVRNSKLDIVYLDTTYSHPKHDFVPQEEAINNIATTVEELLGYSGQDSKDSQPKTLILLSCYSIGKEKVLWEASTRTNQLVYVNEKKLRMLECVRGHQSEEVSSEIIRRCTLDAHKTCIHVIPMGLAGEIWPFFRPNFQKCAKYARDLEQGYEKVVAFLPTGWAHGSKWNREHAISHKMVGGEDGISSPIEVEVRLAPYSEHSAFTELQAFVEYLRPRKVIPTVFGDDAEYRKIEHRFRNLLDTKRAKQAFFRSMKQQQQKPISKTVKKEAAEKVELPSSANMVAESSSDDDVRVVEVRKNPSAAAAAAADATRGNATSTTKDIDNGEEVAGLVAMGFPSQIARKTLRKCRGDLNRAVHMLLDTSGQGKQPSHHQESFPILGVGSPHKRQKHSPSTGKSVPITSFFFQKKKK